MNPGPWRDREFERLAVLFGQVLEHSVGGVPEALRAVVNEYMRVHYPQTATETIPGLDAIVERHAKTWGLTSRDVLLSAKHRAARARADVFIELRGADYSLPQIAKAFGKHHSSVLVAVRKYGGNSDELATRRQKVAA
jgi:chromosomal replication initiation ATPase DnaA